MYVVIFVVHYLLVVAEDGSLNNLTTSGSGTFRRPHHDLWRIEAQGILLIISST